MSVKGTCDVFDPPRGAGADFHTAMVATAAGEKLLIGRRPVSNWTQPLAVNDTDGNAVRYQACLCRKLHLFLGR